MNLRSRRELLKSGLLVSGGVLAASSVGAGVLGESIAEAAPALTVAAPSTPDASLKRLLAGNARFVSGKVRNPRRGNVRRVKVAQGQMPYAVVLTCSDSRVPPELVFDEGLGDIFTVRIAGNTASDQFVVASIEYGVLVLGSILVFVLGHSECGAVKGAIDVSTKGATLPGSIGDLIVPILPAVDQNKNVPKEQLLEAATRSNVHLVIAQLSSVPIIRDAIAQGKLQVAGGEYELESGKVEVIT